MAVKLTLFMSLFGALGLGSAQAAQFDFAQPHVATFVGGSFGTSKIGDSAFSASDGASTSTGSAVPWSTSGAIGIVLPFGAVNFVLSAELIMPKNLSGVNGSDSLGNSLFSLDSKIWGFVPTANVEVLAFKSPTRRTLLGFGGGYALVRLENDYKMTAAGTTAYNVTDYSERGQGAATLLQLYVGEEMIITDTASLVFNLGYRNCVVQSLASDVNVNAIVGQETSGSALLNTGGGHRTIDLSGAFTGVALRFYF